ncbi:stromal cell-derived factor 1 [Pelobates cultripes]|nr:stromal cell-derived factor 1 [Pelobates cultripes]
MDKVEEIHGMEQLTASLRNTTERYLQIWTPWLIFIAENRTTRTQPTTDATLTAGGSSTHRPDHSWIHSQTEQSSTAVSMELRTLALLTLLMGTICLSEEKPVSLSYRCPCRYFESNVAKSNIKHLKILSTTNCSLQIVARLKHSGKQICLDPKIKWIQEYLEKALNK